MRKAQHTLYATLILLTTTLAGGILLNNLLDTHLEKNTRTPPQLAVLVLEEALPGKLCVRNIGTSEAIVDAIHLLDPHHKTLRATHKYPTPHTIPPGEARCLPLPDEFKNHARMEELVAYHLGTHRAGAPVFPAPFLPPPGEVLLTPIVFSGGSEAYSSMTISYGSAETPESGTLLLVDDGLTSTTNYTLLTLTSTGPLALTWEGGFINTPPIPSLSCNLGSTTLMYGIGDNGTGAFHPWYTVVKSGVPQTLSGNQLSLTTFWYNTSGDNTVTYTTGDIILQDTHPTAREPSWLQACGVDAATGRFYILGVERNANLLNTTSNTPATVSNLNFIAYQNPDNPRDSAYILFWWADDKSSVPSQNRPLLEGSNNVYDLLVKGNRVYIAGPIYSPFGTTRAGTGVLSLEASLSNLINATLYTSGAYGTVASNQLFLEDAGTGGLLVAGVLGGDKAFVETLDPISLEPRGAVVAEIDVCTSTFSCFLQDAALLEGGQVALLFVHFPSQTEYSLLLVLVDPRGGGVGPAVNITVIVNGTRASLEYDKSRAYRLSPMLDGGVAIWGPMYNNTLDEEFLGFFEVHLPPDSFDPANLPLEVESSVGGTVTVLRLEPVSITSNPTIASALVSSYHQYWPDLGVDPLGGPGGVVWTRTPKPPADSIVVVVVEDVSGWFVS